jgi:hypothetical protein
MSTTEEAITTEQHKHHDYTIIVNGKEKKVTSEIVTFDEVVHLAFNPLPPGKDFTVTYRDAVKPKAHGTLVEGETVTVKDGTTFHVTPTNKS